MLIISFKTCYDFGVRKMTISSFSHINALRIKFDFAVKSVMVDSE